MIQLQRRNYWYQLNYQGETHWIKIKLKPKVFVAMLKLALEAPQAEFLKIKGLMPLLRRYYQAQTFELSVRQWQLFCEHQGVDLPMPNFLETSVPILDEVSVIKVIDMDKLKKPLEIDAFKPWLKLCQQHIRLQKKELNKTRLAA